MTALLATSGLTAFYGDFQALFGVDLAVEEGETVAVIGANGAGKSTLLRTICGLLPAQADRIRYRRASRIAPLRPPTSWRKAWRWCPKGGGSFPRLPSRKTC